MWLVGNSKKQEAKTEEKPRSPEAARVPLGLKVPGPSNENDFECHSARSTASNDGLRAELNKVMAEQAAFRLELAASRKEQSEMQGQIRLLMTGLAAATRELKDAKADVAACKGELQDAKKELAEHKQELEELKERADTVPADMSPSRRTRGSVASGASLGAVPAEEPDDAGAYAAAAAPLPKPGSYVPPASLTPYGGYTPATGAVGDAFKPFTPYTGSAPYSPQVSSYTPTRTPATPAYSVPAVPQAPSYASAGLGSSLSASSLGGPSLGASGLSASSLGGPSLGVSGLGGLGRGGAGLGGSGLGGAGLGGSGLGGSFTPRGGNGGASAGAGSGISLREREAAYKDDPVSRSSLGGAAARSSSLTARRPERGDLLGGRSSSVERSRPVPDGEEARGPVPCHLWSSYEDSWSAMAHQ